MLAAGQQAIVDRQLNTLPRFGVTGSQAATAEEGGGGAKKPWVFVSPKHLETVRPMRKPKPLGIGPGYIPDAVKGHLAFTFIEGDFHVPAAEVAGPAKVPVGQGVNG